MKLIMPLALLAVLSLGTSCKKTWTCTCQTATSFQDSVLTTGTNTQTFKASRSDAHSRCANTVTTHNVLGFTVKETSNCTLDY
ncbi:MAG: hypothetical protein BGO70_10175 [Bacteroidetes bacterium 43-93]|nr:hypothetical protein [Bacteroidota bacterium]OJX00522.1 MAG: hypothetical protein BGO70_10175 [Bacteroidetes bacterium 43-93]